MNSEQNGFRGEVEVGGLSELGWRVFREKGKRGTEVRDYRLLLPIRVGKLGGGRPVRSKYIFMRKSHYVCMIMGMTLERE